MSFEYIQLLLDISKFVYILKTKLSLETPDWHSLHITSEVPT